MVTAKNILKITKEPKIIVWMLFAASAIFWNSGSQNQVTPGTSEINDYPTVPVLHSA